MYVQSIVRCVLLGGGKTSYTLDAGGGGHRKHKEDAVVVVLAVYVPRYRHELLRRVSTSALASGAY